MEDQSCIFNATFVEEEEHWKFDDELQRTFTAIILIILFTGGVYGNSMTILNVLLSKELKTSAHAFVVSLAVADLLTALLFPFYVQNLLFTGKDLPLPCILCKIVGSVAVFTYSAVIINIGVIAFNRFFRITRPLAQYYRFFNKRTIPIILAFPWICSALFPVTINFLKTLTFGFNHKYKICLIHFPMQIITAPSFFRYLLVDVFFIALTIVCYGKIWLYTRHSHKELRKSYHMIRLTIKDDNKTTGGKTSNRSNEDKQSSVLQKDHRLILDPATVTSSNEEYLNYRREDLQVNSRLNTENVDARDETPMRVRSNTTTKKTNLVCSRMCRFSKTGNMCQSLSKRERTLTKNIFLVTCSIIVCTIPYLACLSSEKLESLFPYVTVFYSTKCCINPLIYALRDPRFRIYPWQLKRARFNNIAKVLYNISPP